MRTSNGSIPYRPIVLSVRPQYHLTNAISWLRLLVNRLAPTIPKKVLPKSAQNSTVRRVIPPSHCNTSRETDAISVRRRPTKKTNAKGSHLIEPFPTCWVILVKRWKKR